MSNRLPCARRLHKVGAGCELITIEGGGHGMGGLARPGYAALETGNDRVAEEDARGEVGGHHAHHICSSAVGPTGRRSGTRGWRRRRDWRIGRARRLHPRELLEVRVPHHHAATASSCSRRSNVPKDVFSDAKTYPILIERTGYNVAPYGIDLYRANLVPQAVRAGEVHLRLPGRARPVHERRRLRHHTPAQAGQERSQKIRMRAQILTTPSTGW